MNITKKIKTNLSKLGVRGTERAVWLELATEEVEPDGYFYIDQKEYGEKLGLKERQLRNHLTHLEQLDLIKKDYRPLETGNRLFICPLEPETSDCMKFSATFLGSELVDTSDSDTPVMKLSFKDAYNRSGTIRFAYCSAFLRGNQLKPCEKLIPNTLVCFSASLKVTQSDKSILAVTHIQPIQRYYYA